MSASLDLVLVTGSNGFIGSHIVNLLLARGVKVKAVARSESSTSGLRKHFGKEVAFGALTFAYVPDMTVDAAFDDAVKGVTGIIHAASPLADRFNGDARRDILDPAIKGATSILRSAAKESSVKSFVLTSSAAAHSNSQGPKEVGDESWNSAMTLEEVEKSDNPTVIYPFSKVYAEKAAWNLHEELKATFSLATVSPVWVAGPTLLPGQIISQGTTGMLWNFAIGNFAAAGDENAPKPWIHVKDVAEAHVRALSEPKAKGRRFLLTADDGTVSALEVAKLARTIQPGRNHCAEPEPGKKEQHERFKIYHITNAKEILGMKPAGIQEIVKDVIEQGIRERRADIVQE